MTDSEGEIECLDEDADIVHQCMQYAFETKAIEDKKHSGPYKQSIQQSREKRKRFTFQDHDDDYDPSESSEKPAKKRNPPPKPQQITKVVKPRERANLFPDHIVSRKLMEIIIPDLEDPLCLPVKAVVRDSLDDSRLKNWNNQCIAHMREHADSLKTENGEAVLSTRTIILKNVKNRLIDKQEVTVRSKITVQDKSGKQQTEMSQNILPSFREKKELNFWLNDSKNKRTPNIKTTTSVILSTEEHKDGNKLIVYTPEDAVTAVYSLIVTPEEEWESSSCRYKRHLVERAACRVCAPCHQAAWRPARHSTAKDMNCSICGRHFVSVYNYLSHLKTHSADQVSRYSKVISKALASVVEYHYKCRICQRKFPGIKLLRNHVKTHKSTEPFLCEIGNHLAR